MANTYPSSDDSNSAVFTAKLMQARAATRDDYIYIIAQGKHSGYNRSIGIINKLNRGDRNLIRFKRTVHNLNQSAICVQRFASTAQDGCIASFDRQGGGINGHIRARLVNDTQHT